MRGAAVAGSEPVEQPPAEQPPGRGRDRDVAGVPRPRAGVVAGARGACGDRRTHGAGDGGAAGAGLIRPC